MSISVYVQIQLECSPGGLVRSKNTNSVVFLPEGATRQDLRLRLPCPAPGCRAILRVNLRGRQFSHCEECDAMHSFEVFRERALHARVIDRDGNDVADEDMGTP